MKRTSNIVTWICIFAVIVGIIPVFLTHSVATNYAHGDTIEFGSYPQTHITDEALISELDEAGNDTPWSSYGYNVTGGADFAFYKDVLLDNVKYRAVRFTMYRVAYGYGSAEDYGLQSARGYVTNTVHWFRFDPISWTVLDPEEGLLIANAVLDSQAINDRSYKKPDSNNAYTDQTYQYYINDYAHSTIRAWLQNQFIATAFSEQETTALTPKMLTDAVADMPEGYDSFSYPSTEDAVFLLSYAEAINTNYFANKSFRSRKGTDYARAQGVNNYITSNPFDFWFLRSPGNQSNHQTHVNLQGNLVTDSADSNGNDIGICPAIYISFDTLDQLSQTGQGATEPTSEPEPSEPTTEPDPTEPVTEPDVPIDPYENISLSFDEGILTVSGTGMIPTAAQIEDTPLAPYADDCKVIIISEGIEGIAQNAFPHFSQLSTLILNGNETLAAGAFSTNETIDTVICSKTVRFSENAFHEASAIDVYELKNAPHNGSLSALCNVMPYSFSDGTLYIEGSTEMDIYALLDLMAVMCGYFDDLRFVRFNSYTSMDVPFYVYSEKESDYVLADNNTLHDVSFSVKISGQEGWQTITFNEFCALAGSHELGTFHLVAEVESGENVQESAFQIMMNNIQIGIKKVLKWIVGLLNYLFNILSKFKTS